MQLCYSVLQKLNHLSRAEMNVFLLLVRYQDSTGAVIGAYYKEFMQEIGFSSKQTFYNVLHSLREKKLITYQQNVKGDFDITVLDNKGYEFQKKPDYIDLNLQIFRTKEFYALKGHEKYMLLEFIRSTKLNRGLRVIGVKELYQKYEGILRVSYRIIQQYLHTLRKYFQISIKKGNYYIQYVKDKLSGVPERLLHSCKDKHRLRTKDSSADQKKEYIGRVLLRRHKLTCQSAEDSLSLGKLTGQYRSRMEELGRNALDIFNTVLSFYADTQPEAFNIKYFHKMLRKALDIKE